MSSPHAAPRINCPIDLFEGCERRIGRLTSAINRASALEEKRRLARALLQQASRLLDCDAYDRDNSNCRHCRDFSTLRHKTVAVIDEAAASRS